MPIQNSALQVELAEKEPFTLATQGVFQLPAKSKGTVRDCHGLALWWASFSLLSLQPLDCDIDLKYQKIGVEYQRKTNFNRKQPIKLSELWV